MAYGVQSQNQQSLKPVSRTQNKNQYDTFYFTDFIAAQITTIDGGVFSTVTSTGTVSTNPTDGITGFGITGCHGTVRLNTSATSSQSAAAAVTVGYNNASYNLLCGIQSPSSSALVSKYEIETLIRTGPIIFDGTTSGGFFRIGFLDSILNSSLNRGVYFERLANGTTNDTTFWVTVLSLSNGSERTNTSVTFSTNTTYRLYLSLEAFTGGTYTITYKIKNMTTGTNTEGTITPTTNRVPTATTDNMAGIVVVGKTAITSTTDVQLHVDYMGMRIRKPISREILLGTL